MTTSKRIFLAVTGASGSIYAESLLKALLESEHVQRIYLVGTETGKQVSTFELKDGLLIQALRKKNLTAHKKLKIFENTDLFCPLASGSSAPTHMVVLPCSMGTAARIRTGISSCLVERAADVMFKQRLPLILCPRETPLSSLHLENLLALSQMGAVILPPMPGFYHHPKTVTELVDFVTGRILEMLHISHEIYTPWAQHQR